MSAASHGQAEGGAANRLARCAETAPREPNEQPKATAEQIGYEARLWQATHALRRSIEAAEREPIALDDAPASSNPSSEATVA